MVYLSTTDAKDTEQVDENAEENSIVRLAFQVTLKPNTQDHVLVTATSNGLLTISLRILRSYRQCTLDNRGMMDVSPGQPFNILVSNFSIGKFHSSKHIKITHTANPLSFIHEVNTIDRSNGPMRPINYIPLEVYISNEVLQHYPDPYDLGDVRHKHSKSRKTQISRHTTVQKNDPHQQAHN